MLLNSFAPDQAVLVEAGSSLEVTRAQIQARADILAGLTTEVPLAFLLADGSLDSATDFHALFQAGIPFALLDSALPDEQLNALIDRYQPEIFCAPRSWADGSGYEAAIEGVWSRNAERSMASVPARPHPDLAILLTTSGSTGSPKFVRLSGANIASNAYQISRSLGLREDDRGVTALPAHYSFGMSVLTSHAVTGSAVVVAGGSVIEPDFWETLAAHKVTILPGVPQTYQMLERLRFEKRFLPQVPSLRALLQAGGRLDKEIVTRCAAAMSERGGQFFVMYGQTEASPRIACLPPERLGEKLGSAGKAMPDGFLEIRDESGQVAPAFEIGEVFYTGPNVMMGYAERRSDLGFGDTHGDTLATGDLGYLDDEGFLFLTGRTKRIAKVAGMRISLDDVERLAADSGAKGVVAIECPPGTIRLVVSTAVARSVADLPRDLAKSMRLPAKSIAVTVVDEVPLLSSGKIDYQRLQELVVLGDAHGSTGTGGGRTR